MKPLTRLQALRVHQLIRDHEAGCAVSFLMRQRPHMTVDQSITLVLDIEEKLLDEKAAPPLVPIR
jgi:hypothetical protein